MTKQEYKKHIASTKKHQVWLHRTDSTNIDSILRDGLHYGAGDLSSTATLQSVDLERAEQSYNISHKGSDSVVVIKIPRKVAKRYYPEKRKGIGHTGYDQDKEITYWNYERGQISIQRQHIHGWIDKETGEYSPNPYLKEPQNFDEKHFPEGVYGELEEKVIGKKPVNKKLGKKKFLPDPPSEISV